MERKQSISMVWSIPRDFAPGEGKEKREKDESKDSITISSPIKMNEEKGKLSMNASFKIEIAFPYCK